MKDEIPLNPDQLKIKTEMQERSLLLSRKYHLPSKSTTHAESYTNRSNVTKEDVLKFIRKLKKGTSPGIDGVTPEHIVRQLSSLMVHPPSTSPNQFFFIP